MNRLVEQDFGDIWFLQDGASAHTVRISMTQLRKMFPARLASPRMTWGAGDITGFKYLQCFPVGLSQ